MEREGGGEGERREGGRWRLRAVEKWRGRGREVERKGSILWPDNDFLDMIMTASWYH